MKSNIGKTFLNKETQYTILEEVVVNDCDGYTVSLLTRNNTKFPCFVIARGVNMENGDWDSGIYTDNLENAFFEMEEYRIIARKLRGIKAPCINHLELFMGSLTSERYEEIINRIANEIGFNNHMNIIIEMICLHNGLAQDVSYAQLVAIRKFCYKVYLKSKGASYFEIANFLCTLAWNTDADIETICKIDRSTFAKAVSEEDYSIGGIFKK